MTKKDDKETLRSVRIEACQDVYRVLVKHAARLEKSSDKIALFMAISLTIMSSVYDMIRSVLPKEKREQNLYLFLQTTMHDIERALRIIDFQYASKNTPTGVQGFLIPWQILGLGIEDDDDETQRLTRVTHIQVAPEEATDPSEAQWIALPSPTEVSSGSWETLTAQLRSSIPEGFVIIGARDDLEVGIATMATRH